MQPRSSARRSRHLHGLRHELAGGRYEVSAREVAEAMLRRAVLVRQVSLALGGPETLSDRPADRG